MNECGERELPFERNERGKIHVENPFKELIKGCNGEWPSAVQRKGYVLAEGGIKKLFMRNLTSDQHFCMYCMVFAGQGPEAFQINVGTTLACCAS